MSLRKCSRLRHQLSGSRQIAAQLGASRNSVDLRVTERWSGEVVYGLVQVNIRQRHGVKPQRHTMPIEYANKQKMLTNHK